MPGTCQKPNCPVATTQKCFAVASDIGGMPHYKADGAPAPAVADEPVGLRRPLNRKSRTPAQTVRGPDLPCRYRARHLGCGRNSQNHMVTLSRTRSTDVGKTCFLCSLYLMATSGSLPVVIFCGQPVFTGVRGSCKGLAQMDGWQAGKTNGRSYGARRSA